MSTPLWKSKSIQAYSQKLLVVFYGTCLGLGFGDKAAKRRALNILDTKRHSSGQAAFNKFNAQFTKTDKQIADASAEDDSIFKLNAELFAKFVCVDQTEFDLIVSLSMINTKWARLIYTDYVSAIKKGVTFWSKWKSLALVYADWLEENNQALESHVIKTHRYVTDEVSSTASFYKTAQFTWLLIADIASARDSYELYGTPRYGSFVYPPDTPSEVQIVIQPPLYAE